MPAQQKKPSLENILSDDGPMSGAELLAALAAARERLRAGSLSEEEAARFASWASSQFWLHYLADGSYLAQAVTLLCELAVQPDPVVAQAGRQAIFSSLVEPLSDAFDADYCALYDRMFVQVIDWCRRQPAGALLHRALNRFGLRNAEDLLARKRRLDRQPARFDAMPERIKKVILLSRVTLGAEIAVTATIIATLKAIFPGAQYVLLAACTVRRVFARDERISVHDVSYNRQQGLIEQFDTWLDVTQAIRAETEGLRSDEFVVVDPDSRLSQLGLLPVVEDESRYAFFPSRSFGGQGSESVGELAARWAEQAFGVSERRYPQLGLPDEDWNFAHALAQRLEEADTRRTVVINLGVGGNAAKRLSESFEHELVLRLVESGSRVLLAKGIGTEETERSNRLLRRMAERGNSIHEFDTSHSFDFPAAGLDCDILAWQGNVGTYCALIGSFDEYIGYDSGGQHIAAALGTPTIDIFAHSPYPLFMQRWRPYGPGVVHIVDATGQNSPIRQDSARLLDQIVGYHAQDESRGTGKKSGL